MFLAIAASIRVHLCFYIGIVFLMEYFKNARTMSLSNLLIIFSSSFMALFPVVNPLGNGFVVNGFYRPGSQAAENRHPETDS